MNKVPRWVFRYVGNKTFDFSSKKKDFLPQNDQIWPKIGIFGQLCALLVSRLVVVARGLYLARHLFTLFTFTPRRDTQPTGSHNREPTLLIPQFVLDTSKDLKYRIFM